MTQILEESEKSEEEEEEDDFNHGNKTLAINLPKHIKDSFRRKQSELEMISGNRDSISPLKIQMDSEFAETPVGISINNPDLLKKISHLRANKSSDFSIPFISLNSQSDQRKKQPRSPTKVLADNNSNQFSSLIVNAPQPTQFEYKTICSNTY